MSKKKQKTTYLARRVIKYSLIIGVIAFFFYLQQFKALAAQEATNKFQCAKVSKKELFSSKPDKEHREKTIDSFNNSKQRLFKHLQNKKNINEVKKDKELAGLIKERKERFIETMQEDPTATLFSVLSQSEKTTINEVSDNCAEESIVVEGALEVIHADYFNEGTDDTQYFLKTTQGKLLHLHPARGLKDFIESRTKVRISGYRIDNEVLFDGSSSTAAPKFEQSGIDVLAQPGNPPVLGDQKTVVIMANFQNTIQPNLTTAQVQDVVFTQTNNYYKENSYDKISLSGDVFGWYTLPINQMCDAGTVQDEAIKKADPDINFLNYGRLIIIAPFSPNCTWAGIGTIGKQSINTSDGFVDMSVSWILSSSVGKTVIGHELGHNFGNHHAQFLDCGPLTVANSGCSKIEYGDYYDIMGSSAVGHFNAPHKENMGWLDSSNITTVTTNGSYTIEPLESKTTGQKALKIQRTVDDYLYIEYRQPIGSDIGLASPFEVFNGALMHVISDGMYHPLLIDVTPPGNAASPTLKLNQTFTDPQAGTSITTTNLTQTAITLSVTLGATDFTPPSVSITSPTQNSILNGMVNITATATDASGIEKVEFYSSASADPIGVDTTEPYSIYQDMNTIPNGNQYIYALAYDKSTQSFGTVGNIGKSAFVYVVLNGDTTLPLVSIVAPSAGSVINGITNIIASASDEVGINRVEFYLDEILIDSARSMTDSYFTSIDISSFALNGTHTITATAIDKSGNTNTTPPISINIQNSIQWGSIKQITTNALDQQSPAISGNNIVWQDSRNGNNDIYLYDLNTNTEKRITTNTASQFSPAISGNNIVWQDNRNGASDIYLYDLNTNTERRITTNTIFRYSPAISGNNIVWQESRNGNKDIYLYDLNTNTERQITTNVLDQQSPAISGNNIVWHDNRNGNNDIYLYDLNTNTERQITTNVLDQYSSAISGNYIVWQDNRNGNNDIYFYDLNTNIEKQITTNTLDQYSPAISGNNIVWQDNRNGNNDIYLYDLNTNVEKQITTNTLDQYSPAISGNNIVWQDNRNGNYNIYMYKIVSNTAPVIQNLETNKTINENSLLSFIVSATVADGGILTYSATGLPVGATFDPLTQTFSWIPNFDQSGTYSVIFTVTDTRGLSDNETVSITVNNVNRQNDLIVSAVSSSTVNAVTGGALTITSTVKNQGNAATGKTFFTGLFLLPSLTSTTGIISLGRWYRSTSLDAGGQGCLTLSFCGIIRVI